MVPFNPEPQHAAFRAKIICALLFLWGLQTPKNHARSHKTHHPVREESLESNWFVHKMFKINGWGLKSLELF